MTADDAATNAAPTDDAATDRRVVQEPDRSRFALYVGDALAGFAAYTDRDGVRDFDHTVTEPEFRGRGVAGEVVGHALARTLDEGLGITASCSYVAKYLSEHPEIPTAR